MSWKGPTRINQVQFQNGAVFGNLLHPSNLWVPANCYLFGSMVGVVVLITSVHQLLTYSAFSGRGLSLNIEEINLCGDNSFSIL